MLLDDETFTIFAAKYYDMARSSGIDEFNDDLKRFQYLKRLFKRYEEDNDLRIRLILNHMIILYNCFGPVATHMLFFKLKEYHIYLKPICLFLNYLPDRIEYEDVRLDSKIIPMDVKIAQELTRL